MRKNGTRSSHVAGRHSHSSDPGRAADARGSDRPKQGAERDPAPAPPADLGAAAGEGVADCRRGRSPQHPVATDCSGRPSGWPLQSVCGETSDVSGDRDSLAGAAARLPPTCTRSLVRGREAPDMGVAHPQGTAYTSMGREDGRLQLPYRCRRGEAARKCDSPSSRPPDRAEARAARRMGSVVRAFRKGPLRDALRRQVRAAGHGG